MAELRHAGDLALDALGHYGIDTMFTLNGGHIWPFYDAARHLGGWRIIDTRHEATATFAAEGYAKLTRTAGLAALTAGPGVTNGVSAITSAHIAGSPVIVLGGRAPQMRWGSGSLQEFDHVPVVSSITRLATTCTDGARAGEIVTDAAVAALSAHRGPAFVDFPLDVFGPVPGASPAAHRPPVFPAPDPDLVADAARRIAAAERPAFIVGSDAYWAQSEEALIAAASALGVPCWFNGLGRGLVAADHPNVFLRTRALVKAEADLVVVIGAPLDFRLGFGRFGSAEVIHVVDHESERAGHVTAALTVAGDIAATLAGIAAHPGARRDHGPWLERLRIAETAAVAADRLLLASAGNPIKPARIYGDLLPRLERDAVIVCDGGDFASYAGKFVEVFQPGCWLDTGPYGCLGNGPGYAIAARVARPHSQIVLLLGDGAAGFSLMDVDTMVRHRLPVVMVVGNNGMWGLEKHPMQAIYGWDLACDLRPNTHYDDVVRALGGAGETVHDAANLGAALDRAFAAGVPYLVNVITDPTDVYPRTSNLG